MTIEFDKEVHTPEHCRRVVAHIVNRMHVRCSDRGVKSNVGRKLSKDISPELRKALLDAALQVHHINRDFYVKMRFGTL